MGLKENVGGGISGLAWLTASLLGLVIHVWTIVIAFSVSGIVAAVLTLIFPVISEAFWFFRVGSNLSFSTTYCVSIMAYIGLLGVGFLGVVVASSGD